MEPNSKVCNECEIDKGFQNYNVSKSGRFGYCNICKECRSKNRKKLAYKRPTTGTKTCNDCKKTLDVSCFYSDKSASSGLQTYCKECGINHTKKWASTLDGYCKRIFKDTQINCKRRKKDLELTITLNDIKELYTKQNGLCALTGVKMTFDTYQTRGNKQIINVYNMSIDRINSDKGYTKDNIQLVCAMINRMKSDLTDEKFIELCALVVNHSKK
jgi:hypothetical protein